MANQGAAAIANARRLTQRLSVDTTTKIKLYFKLPDVQLPNERQPGEPVECELPSIPLKLEPSNRLRVMMRSLTTCY